jgi:hypothetical protein
MQKRTMGQSERGKKRTFFVLYFPFLKYIYARKCSLFFGVTPSAKFANLDGFSQKCCLKNDKTLFYNFFYEKVRGTNLISNFALFYPFHPFFGMVQKFHTFFSLSPVNIF